MLEMIVALALGSLILVATGAALGNVTKIFRNTSGRDQALRDLAKAHRSLELDLRLATSNALSIVQAPASLGGGADGDAINYLSAVNTTDGNQAILQDGSGNPYHFLNCIYYLTTPTDHDTLFSNTCVGGNEGGYDYQCPHKILLRVIEDENPAYDPTDQTTQDTLLPSLATFLVRPTGFPNSMTRRTVAINLLTFQVRRVNRELVVDLWAVSLADARRKLAIGTTSLRNSPYTVKHQFSVFPKN